MKIMYAEARVWFYLRTRREKNQNIMYSSTPERIVRRDKSLRIREYKVEITYIKSQE